MAWMLKSSCSVAEEGSSWDMVSENDLWEDEELDLEQEDYVLVRQEDIVEGIACFMAAYLLSLKQTKVCYISALFEWKEASCCIYSCCKMERGIIKSSLICMLVCDFFNEFNFSDV
jgi:hypothetical protein